MKILLLALVATTLLIAATGTATAGEAFLLRDAAVAHVPPTVPTLIAGAAGATAQPLARPESGTSEQSESSLGRYLTGAIILAAGGVTVATSDSQDDKAPRNVQIILGSVVVLTGLRMLFSG